MLNQVIMTVAVFKSMMNLDFSMIGGPFASMALGRKRHSWLVSNWDTEQLNAMELWDS